MTVATRALVLAAGVAALSATASCSRGSSAAKGTILPSGYEIPVAHLRGNYQMPPRVSHRIDDAGTQLLADWIDALPP